MNRIAFGGDQFIIAFDLRSPQGGAMLESVRLLPQRRFDRDSMVWKAPWSAAPQVRGLAERYGFDVTPEAKAILDATKPLEVPSLLRRVSLTPRGLEFKFSYDKPVVEDVRTIPGREFDIDRKVWWIPTKAIAGVADIVEAVARRNGFIVDIDAQQYLRRSNEARLNLVAASSSLNADIDLPGIVGELHPFQKAGVAYALKTKRLIIGDPVGLGKTVQALATVEAANAYPALFVCKPVARWQIEEEVRKWLPHRTVNVLSGETARVQNAVADWTIIPWSVLDAWKDVLAPVKFKAVVPDELHMIKSRTAKRTKAVKAVIADTEYRIGLTATDVKSRPNELVSQLEVIDRLKDFGGWYAFVTTYCGGYKDRFGWQTGGATNIGDLHNRLRAVCYVRREKSDILKELPPVQNTMVPLDLTPEARSAYKRAEADLITWLGEKAEREAQMKGLPQWEQRKIRASAEFKAQHNQELLRIGALKQIAADGKIKAVTEWVYDFLNDSEDEKIIVFTEHRKMTEALAKEFEAPAIYGGVTDKKREAIRDAFQNDPKERVLIANYISAGESLTLTAANHIAFAEFPWTPADVDQAIGRAYGRLNDIHGVTAWWLMARNTIEEDIVTLLGVKRVVTSKVVTGLDVVADETSMIDALTARLANRAA